MFSATISGNVGSVSITELTNKTTGNKFYVAKFSVAINKYVNGEQKTQWINCKAIRPNTNQLQFLQKGSKVTMIADIEEMNYFSEKTNTQVNSVVFVVEKLDIHNTQQQQRPNHESNNYSNQQPQNQSETDLNEQYAVPNQPNDNQEDDKIPF